MPTADDGSRENQLKGKQLVFLFMSVTVVAVVIFLCGVLVGRGVQARTSAVVEAAVETPGEAAIDELPVAVEPAAGDEPTPEPALTFPSSLTDQNPPDEKLSPAGKVPAAPARRATPSATRSAAAAPPNASTTTATGTAAKPDTKTVDLAPPTPGVATEPRGPGFAIQVAALSGRGEAESIVRRLAGKGYTAYLMSPLSGQPSVFRVRVGKFKQRNEAEAVATRLEREEQFKPWITR